MTRITHIEAARLETLPYTRTSYCGRVVEDHRDLAGTGSHERITYLPHTRHLATPPDNDSRQLCRTCLRALAAQH